LQNNLLGKIQGKIEVDDVFLGSNLSGKIGNGSEGKSIIAVDFILSNKITSKELLPYF
jgi:hypothetical protein